MLPQIDIHGQEKLLSSTALIIGLGGLGSPSAMYLASSGVGHLILVDHDIVELSNLQRQIIHTTKSIGNHKVDSAKRTLLDLNPDIKITEITSISDNTIGSLVNEADVVLDGTDNFDTRFMINKACVLGKTPLVSASVIKMEGQLSVFRGYQKDKPCYQCLYKSGSNEDLTCVNNGVLSPVAGVMGSLQAVEAIKVLLNLGNDLTGKILMYDAMDVSFNKLNIGKDKTCPICN